MEDKKPIININPITVGIIVLQIFFIILMVFSFWNFFNQKEPSVNMEVAGLVQEIPGLPNRGKDDIEYNIYKAVSRNSVSNEIQKKGVYIREGSLVNDYYENMDIHYVGFIADIPDIRQSYKVVYEWSDDKDNEYLSPDYSAVTMCLDESQLIYGDFNCSDEKNYVKNIIVSDMIRGNEFTLPGYEDIGLSFESSPRYGDFKIKINYLACGYQCICQEVSQEEKERALKGFEEFINKLGFIPEEIPYYFYNCGDD